jgi:hypothetical protein
MTAVVSLVARDVFARGGWLLLVMFALQFTFAMHFLGVYIRDAEVLLMIMTGLAMWPVRAPSYRLLMTLPLPRRAVDCTDWLFSGGLMAAICTCANLAALAICWRGSMVLVDGWRVTLLVAGAPGLIGLFMVLRRYSGVGVKPANSDRLVLLPALFSLAFLFFYEARVKHGSSPGVVGGLVIFAAGCFVLALFLLSPDTYRRWIKPPKEPAQRSSYFWLHTPWRLVFTLAMLAGGLQGMLLGFAYCSPSGPFVKLLALALMSVHGLLLVRAIKVFRSLPWSLDRCTIYVFAALVGPPLAAMLSALGAGAWRSCVAAYDSQGAILPLLAIAAAVSVLMTRLILRDKLRPYFTFGIMIGMLALVIDHADLLHALYDTLQRKYVAPTQLIAALLLTMAYFWLRHEIRTNAILLHHRPAGPLGAIAS